MKRTLKLGTLVLVLVTLLGLNSLRADNNAPDDADQPDDGQVSSTDQAKVSQFKTVTDLVNSIGPQFLADNQGVGIAIGIIQDGKPQAFYFGETAKGNGKKPDGSTLFLIGSITKTFTAAMLALDVEKGLVHLNDPLQNFFPTGMTVPTFNSQPITLRNLATHSAGLPRNPGNAGPATAGNYTVAQMDDFLSHYTLTSAPGTTFLYSNLGYGLLGRALEKVDGQPWESTVIQEIAAPLGMVDTNTALSPEQMTRRAQGYTANGQPGNYMMKGWPAENPAGALYSTMDDMMKYLNYNVGLTDTPLNSLRSALFQPLRPAGPNAQIGLSWMISPLPGTSQNVLWKPGSAGGFYSYIGFLSNSNNGVVLLVNFSTKNLNSLGQEILGYLAQPAPATAAAATPATPAATGCSLRGGSLDKKSSARTTDKDSY